jgi:polar amino acid transport system substrate-binding protein
MMSNRLSVKVLFLIGSFLIVCLFTKLHAVDENVKPLTWGADAQSGVPYVFYETSAESKTTQKLVGFEVEIVEYIARNLRRPSVFVQNEWPSLIPGLQRGLYDIAINGIVPPASGQVSGVVFSEPYLITSMALTIRKDNTEIRFLEDCRGKRVGAITATDSVDILRKLGNVDVKLYDTEINAFTDLAMKRIDAVFMDVPLGLYYGGVNPQLQMLPQSIGRIEYCIAVQSHLGPEFLAKVNAALEKMKASGELRRVLERWSLWNEYMADYLNDYRANVTPHAAYDSYLTEYRQAPLWKVRFERYWNFMPILLQAALVTVQVSVCSMALAIILGFFLAILRVYGAKPFQIAVSGFIEIIRGTPLLIQLLLIFYGLPNLGIELSPFMAGVVGLGLNYAAYEAENYRAGLLSVPVCQIEAASALAMNHSQALRHVIIPQAFRVVIPPMTNDFISLVKDSSLVSMITIVELTQRYNELATTYYDYFGFGILVGAMYMILGLPFIRFARYAEEKFAR